MLFFCEVLTAFFPGVPAWLLASLVGLWEPFIHTGHFIAASSQAVCCSGEPQLLVLYVFALQNLRPDGVRSAHVTPTCNAPCVALSAPFLL